MVTKMTDLIQSLEHGTGPTVTRKVALLNENGFIKMVPSTVDGRIKNIELTPKAIQYLSDQHAKLQLAMKQR